MPDTLIAEDIRLGIAQSIAIIEKRQSILSERMEQELAAAEAPGEAFGQGEIAGLLLTDLLLRGAREIAAESQVQALQDVAREHERLAINGVHYSRFGVVLPAVLRQVFGPALPPRIAAAWVDGFWFIIRGLEEVSRTPRSDEALVSPASRIAKGPS